MNSQYFEKIKKLDTKNTQSEYTIRQLRGFIIFLN